MSRHFLTTTIEVGAVEVPIMIAYEYDRGDPGAGPSWNDGGWPSEPPNAEIISVQVRMEDGWMAASERIERLVDGDINIYEEMLDAAADDLAGKYDDAVESAAEFRRAS